MVQIIKASGQVPYELSFQINVTIATIIAFYYVTKKKIKEDYIRYFGAPYFYKLNIL